MKDFEKFLTDLPKPDADVPAFRAQLRRELLSAAPSGNSPRWRGATILTGSVAAALALTLGLFVARPAIPAGIHSALSGGQQDAWSLADVRSPLQPAGLPAAADRAFVDQWTAQQARPVAVRSMQDERLVSVRQFELTDGKRMLVFTELGDETAEPTIVRADSSRPVF